MPNGRSGQTYEKVELGNIVSIDTIKQEIEADKLDDEEDEIILYHEIITNKVEKDNTIISQMEQW